MKRRSRNGPLYPQNSEVSKLDSSIIHPISTAIKSPNLFHKNSQQNPSTPSLLQPNRTSQPLIRTNHSKMATAFATSSTVVALGSSSLSSPSSRSPRLVSGFVKSPVAARNPLTVARASGGRFTCFQRDWLRRDLNVIGFGLIGWIAPSSIPVIDGKSLTGLFFESIGTELAHFPSPPPLTSQFWLWLVTWHLGLFITLTFGQIGFKGRTEDYFSK